MTLREIGDRAGVSRTAAYRHFSDKAELLAAISDAGFNEFADALERARDGAEGSFSSKLDAMGRAYIQFADEHRAYYEVMFGVGESPAGARAFGILEETIRKGQATGEVRAGDPVFLAKVVWALSHGIAMLKFETGFMVDAGKVLRTGLQYF